VQLGHPGHTCTPPASAPGWAGAPETGAQRVVPGRQQRRQLPRQDRGRGRRAGLGA
jgi:hypothetical protein